MRTGIRLSITTIFLATLLPMQNVAAQCAALEGCPGNSNSTDVAAVDTVPLAGKNSCFASSAVDGALEYVLCEEDFGIGECSLLKQVSRKDAGPVSMAMIAEEAPGVDMESLSEGIEYYSEEGC